MNKDLYIALLEDHVGDLSTAMKIDTVLTSRKTEKIRGLKSELVSSRDWNNAQDELISKIADTAMDYIDDLNDQQADWAESNVVAGTAMLAMAKEISRITEERNRFRGVIRELKREKYDLGKKLFDLEKQGVGDS